MPRLTLDDLPPGHCCTFARTDIRHRDPGPAHDHDFHEFFWVEEGTGVHHLDGKALPLKEGDLVVIRARDSHAFGADRDGGLLRIVNFAFFARCWDDFRRRYFDGRPVFFSSPSLADRSYELEPSQLTAIQSAARHLRAGARGRLHVESFLLTVLTLLQESRAWTPRREEAAPRWIGRACAQVGQGRNFAGGMEALSRLAGRSPEHIAREFRRHLGRTPTEVINRARMAFAADRLATSDETILAIALDCGLQNLGHFYRLFHAAYGCTPRRYRLHQQAALGRAAG